MLTDKTPLTGGARETPLAAPIVAFSPPVDEKREATRFRREEGTDFAVIWHTPGEEHLVEVHDESLTGLGLIVDPIIGLKIGTVLNVVYAGEHMDGEVRHIEEMTGKHLVGLRCARITPRVPEDH